MERLTETKFEREMRIGFAMIDRHFDDAIVKLDALKKEYERKLPPKASDLLAQIRQAMGLIRSGQDSYANQLGKIQYPSSQDLYAQLQGFTKKPIYQSGMYGMSFFINPSLARDEIRIVP